MSLKRLIGGTILDLLLIVVIGESLALFHISKMFQGLTPMLVYRAVEAVGINPAWLGLQEQHERTAALFRYEMNLEVPAGVQAPADDLVLAGWLREKASWAQVEVLRKPIPGGELVVARTLAPQGLSQPQVPWKDLGYTKPDKSRYYDWEIHQPENPYLTPPQELLLCQVCYLHLGLFVVGVWRMIANRKLEQPQPSWEGKAVFAGIGIGFGLAALAWLSTQALLLGFGPRVALGSFWRCLPSIGWNIMLEEVPVPSWHGADPHPILMWLALAIGLGFPAVQEIYFRGGLLPRWAAAGYVKTGSLIAAVVAGVLMLDWVYFPLFFVVGLILCWLTHWTRSGFSSFIANLLFFVSLVGISFGMIPSLPALSERVSGRWQLAGEPGAAQVLGFERQPVQLVRGGSVRTPVVTIESQENGIGLRTRLTPLRYDWLDDERIRVRTRQARGGSDGILNVQTIFEEYRVRVDGNELILTRVPGGQEMKYRRAE
jgi:membrane protease YdiL (CAAX protease family)